MNKIYHSTRFTWLLLGANLLCPFPYRCPCRIFSSRLIFQWPPRRTFWQLTEVRRNKPHLKCTPRFFLNQSRARCELLNSSNYLFSSNQLSKFTLKSMWSPKLPGREEVVKNVGFSKTICVLVNFLFSLSLYSEITPKLYSEA